MARSRRTFSRPITIVFGVALLIGAIAVLYKMLGHSSHGVTPNVVLAKEETPAPTAKLTKVESAKTESTKPNASGLDPFKSQTPTTKPTDAPALRATTPAQPLPPNKLDANVRKDVPTTRPIETPANVNLPTVFADAQKLKAEDPLGARRLLIGAIDTGKLTAEQKDEALKVISEINSDVVFSPRKFIRDETSVQYQVKSGDSLERISKGFDVPWQWIGRLNNISDPRKLQAGKTLKVIKGPFHALVSKSHFTIDIYIGKPTEPGAVFLKRFRVGLGENDSTPTGTWQVADKLINPRYYNPRSEGPRVIESGDPANPLGPRWIALNGIAGEAQGKTSYGIHGTIDPNSIGQKKSMGCVRMLNEDVEWVFDMLVTGKSTVTVVD